MLEIQSRGKEIIARRAIEQIKPIKIDYTGNVGIGVTAKTVPFYNTGNQNVALGYQAGLFNVGTGISTAKILPNNNITFNTPSNPVLTITGDGDVIWSGKPSEAANILVQSFQFKVEQTKGFTKAARRRYYLKACQNILNKAEKMEYSEFIDFLRKQVYNRERKVIIDSLKGN